MKKRGGGGGGGEVPFWPDRYEMPGVLYVSTFGLDTKSGPQRGSGRPGMAMWARACIMACDFTRLPPN